MQPDMIPFDATRSSFVLVIFLMIALVFTVRIISRYAILYWPLLEEIIALRLKKKKLRHDVDSPSEEESPELHIPTEPWYNGA
jgi:hypothetical protein